MQDTRTEKRSSLRLVVAAAAAGTAFEWYDFFIFGALASILSSHFFADLPEAEAFIMTLATFAAGLIARPFGALFFGRIGDTKGRKGAFLATILIMGAATFAIGLLPTFETAGLLAPIALVICRIVQGVALGGEYGGAAIFVAEHSAPNRRGRDTGWIQTSAALGLILALSIILAIRALIGEQDFAAWGWRIPFLLSSVLVAASIWIRLQIDESPVFKQMHAEGRAAEKPLAETFLKPRNLGLLFTALFGVMMPSAVIWYVGYFYGQYFLERVLHVSGATVTAIMLFVSVVSAALYVLFAWISDFVGRKPVMLFGLFLMLVAAFPGFRMLTHFANPQLEAARAQTEVVLLADPAECALQLDLTGGARSFASSCDIAKSVLAGAGAAYRLEQRAGLASVRVNGVEIAGADARGASREDFRAARADFEARLRAALTSAGYPARAEPADVNLVGIIGVLIVFMIAATAMYGPLAACFVELFPARIRYTALSFPYHVGTGWFGGLAPAIAFAAMTATGDIYAGLWYPVGLSLIALPIMLLFLPETRGRPIEA